MLRRLKLAGQQPTGLLLGALLLLLSLLSPLYPPLGWTLLALAGIGGVGLGLGSPWLCCQLMILGLFTGILTSLPVSFTLKAPQLFSLLGLAALGLQTLLLRRWPRFDWRWTLPFGLFVLSLLPSFLHVDRQLLSLSATDTPLRLLFNYGLLQLFTLFLLLEADSLEKIQRLLKLGWISCLASLLFGFAQQAGYYAGRYDPYAHVGQHSSIVDFYGPFLRMAPGTFANEYGEILQSVGLLLAGWLLLMPGARRRWMLLLLLVMVALVLNFTRASWLVFAFGCLLLMLAARLRPSALIGSVLLGGATLGLLLYLSQILLEASVLLSVGQRFGELGQVQAHSAGQRLGTWQLAWEAFRASPWIGQGWGLYGETHNVPLQLLAETGLLGFCGFYGLMLWCLNTIRKAWQASRQAEHKALLLSFTVAWLGCLAFDLTNHGIFHFVLWYCLGMALALARLSLQPGESETSASGRRV